MARRRSCLFILGVALSSATVALAADAGSVHQRILVEPASQAVAPGEVATVRVVYDATDATLSGIGVRVHYDSTKLTLEGADLLFSAGNIGHQDQPDAGSAYASEFDDGNPETDRRYLSAWVGMSAGWPGESTELPLDLLSLRFRVNDGVSSAAIALTGNTCVGCRLEVGSASIQVVGRDLVSAQPGPTASAPSPTTTPTPGFFPTSDESPGDGFVPLGTVPLGVPAIPTLSELGAVVFGAALGACAIALLLRRRG